MPCLFACNVAGRHRRIGSCGGIRVKPKEELAERVFRRLTKSTRLQLPAVGKREEIAPSKKVKIGLAIYKTIRLSLNAL